MSDVLAEDQLKICEFSKYFDKTNMAKQRLSVLSKKFQEVNDAQDEVTASLEPPLLRVGDCFYKINEDNLEEILEKMKADLAGDVERIKTDIDDHSKKIMSLKTALYSKFGNRINLD
ncbi:prefoldin subunit 4 [Babesia microti strain RI]|uniref:Prefoldin subunit 4 n=1 Tax=Babesia microti (strain RI) TaxID=1133968 RepID=I7IT40_BABMR|nr:prefoldin subunit 4 [Babesia microti strain RI]CCF76056.1 prefoldin subunit 4 [Babesia microti strain RI]|eukprot:XP_012650464.1 prefoldin subunit 4 [Babesia microti strain RI]